MHASDICLFPRNFKLKIPLFVLIIKGLLDIALTCTLMKLPGSQCLVTLHIIRGIWIIMGSNLMIILFSLDKQEINEIFVNYLRCYQSIVIWCAPAIIDFLWLQEGH